MIWAAAYVLGCLIGTVLFARAWSPEIGDDVDAVFVGVISICAGTIWPFLLVGYLVTRLTLRSEDRAR